MKCHNWWGNFKCFVNENDEVIRIHSKLTVNNSQNSQSLKLAMPNSWRRSCLDKFSFSAMWPFSSIKRLLWRRNGANLNRLSETKVHLLETKRQYQRIKCRCKKAGVGFELEMERVSIQERQCIGVGDSLTFPRLPRGDTPKKVSPGHGIERGI